MNPATEILETWLQERLGLSAKAALIDVGAYHGDFTASLRDRGVFKQAHLFEPNPQNIKHLEARFAQDRDVALHRCAMGSHSGSANFFCSSDPATGSVLPYLGSAEGVGKQSVAQNTLDDWWLQSTGPDVGLIKIDTQGADLDVLQGAEKTVARFRPWIVAELIFVPLYRGQARPGALLSWAESRDYRMTGLFNEHRTPTGCIAFADAVLAPVEKLDDEDPNFVARPAIESLGRQIAELRGVCDERLALIERLHDEAEKRLQIIRQLTGSRPGA
jgi:FkbM family methyltransferase